MYAILNANMHLPPTNICSLLFNERSRWSVLLSNELGNKVDSALKFIEALPPPDPETVQRIMEILTAALMLFFIVTLKIPFLARSAAVAVVALLQPAIESLVAQGSTVEDIVSTYTEDPDHFNILVQQTEDGWWKEHFGNTCTEINADISDAISKINSIRNPEGCDEGRQVTDMIDGACKECVGANPPCLTNLPQLRTLISTQCN
jgi:hypothetical protein